MKTATTYTEIVGRAFRSAFVKPIFAILFFKISIRAWGVWRGIVVIEIRLVNDLNIIQNHVGMNFLKQVISIYVLTNQEHYYSGLFPKGDQFTILESKYKQNRENDCLILLEGVFALLIPGLILNSSLFHHKNRREQWIFGDGFWHLFFRPLQ